MTQSCVGFPILVLIVTLGLLARSISASQADHRYNFGDHVPLFVNKVGPLNNPSETYEYFDLPFCRPDYLVKEKESLGEVISGDRLTTALYDISFREVKTGVVLCKKTLKDYEIVKFKDAIINDYYFQMYYDDLPLWGFVGKVEDESWALNGSTLKYYLFNHVNFNAFYNGDQVIQIDAFSDPSHIVDITEDKETSFEFTYSISWNATSAHFGDRMLKYSRASVLQTYRRIHWFSFVNSVVIVVLLALLLVLLFTRHLKNDLRRFTSGDEEDDKEIGWKYIHSDVFRCPPQMPLFCALVGAGTQLLTLVCLLFALAFLGFLYPYNRGSLCTAVVVIYTFTSAVAGYSSVSCFNQFSESKWGRTVALAGLVYLGPSFLILSVLNLVAVIHGATLAIPFGTIVVMFAAFTFLGVPLLAFGGIIANRNRPASESTPTRKKIPREIPPSAWYRKTPGQMLIGGLLPFSAVVLELHNLYASIWGYKIFTLPSILFITFVTVIILVAMLSIGLTYIQLTVEDHEWWWRSVLRGGSVAIFMFGYSIYFFARSNMNGFFQLSFFLGYNACLCYAFFLMLGTISFYASSVFVRHIYRAVKDE